MSKNVRKIQASVFSLYHRVVKSGSHVLLKSRLPPEGMITACCDIA